MIGPFSTTLIPLSSSWSVDRQVLINVEASAISRDERKFGFIFRKIPIHKAFGWRKKGSRSLDQIACTFSLFAPPPPPPFFLHQPPLSGKLIIDYSETKTLNIIPFSYFVMYLCEFFDEGWHFKLSLGVKIALLFLHFDLVRPMEDCSLFGAAFQFSLLWCLQTI